MFASSPWPARCAALAFLAACGACLCPPKPAEIAAARLDTPRHTVEAFQVDFRAGLYEREYYCFSRDFLARNQLSLFTYSEFRDHVPWMARFARAKVIADRPGEKEGEHWVEVSVAGRTLRVRLVREDSWRIQRQDRWMSDLTRFDQRVRVAESEQGTSVSVEIPLARLDFDPREADSITLERQWKIDDVLQLDT